MSFSLLHNGTNEINKNQTIFPWKVSNIESAAIGPNWRKQKLQQEKSAGYLKIQSLPSSFQLENTTCFAAHNSLNIVAQANAKLNMLDDASAMNEPVSTKNKSDYLEDDDDDDLDEEDEILIKRKKKNSKNSNENEIQFIKIDKAGTSTPTSKSSSVDHKDSVEYKVLLRMRPGSGTNKLEHTSSVFASENPNFPIYDIDFVEDLLLCSSNEGRVLLYRLNSFENKSLDLSALKPEEYYQKTRSTKQDLNFSVYTHKKVRQHLAPTTATPEHWNYSSRVNRVELNRNDSNLFLSLENYRLHIWDLERENAEPVASLKGSNEPLFCGQWNPQHHAQIIFSGASTSIKMIDARAISGEENAKLVGWKIDNAHSDVIRDIKWNPFVPYWIATAGDDSIIKVWDIRYNSNKPLLTLFGHENIIKKISWSECHSEILASGGVDQQLIIWSLKNEPIHVLTNIKDSFTDSVVGVEFSINRPMQLYGVSSKGEFNTITLSNDYLKPQIVSRFSSEPEYATERQIETNIYLRDFSNAFQQIIWLAKKYKDSNELKKALTVLELSKPKDFSTDKREGDPTSKFTEELSDFSYFIPPNFPTLSSNSLQSYIKQINDMIINCQILSSVQQNEFSQILTLEMNILDLLEKDVNCIEILTIQDVLDLYMAHDFIRGMNLVIKIAKLFQRKGKFAIFEPIAKTVLSPTTFDVSQNPTLQEAGYRNLTKVLADSDRVIAQLNLHKDVICTLWIGDAIGSAQRIASIIDNSDIPTEKNAPVYTEIISTAVLRTYLNALLCLKKLDRFYIVAVEMMQKFQGFDFGNTVKNLMEEVAFVQYSQQVNDNLTSMMHDLDDDSMDEKDALQFLKQSKQVMMNSLNIALCSPFIPDFLTISLGKALDHTERSLAICLKTIYSSKQVAEQEAMKHVKALLQGYEMEKLLHDKSSFGNASKSLATSTSSKLKSGKDSTTSNIEEDSDKKESSIQSQAKRIVSKLEQYLTTKQFALATKGKK